MACPNCNDPTAWTRCWECGWTLPEEGCTTDVPPSVRDAGVKAVKDTRTEAEVQLAIRRTAEALGFDVFDLSQGRPTRQPSGICDLYVRGHGRRVWIEVKRPIGGRVSEHQEAFIAGEVANGGEAFVARSETDFINWYGGDAA